MWIDLVILGAGLAVLVWSADQFVLGASRLAVVLALPPIVIGAVIMGFGTSAPELLVSSIAAANGDRDLGVGNIIGSNVANLSLVLGTAAFVARMTIPRGVFTREGPMSILAAFVFAAFVVDGEIARWEGAILIGLLAGAIGTLLWTGHHSFVDEIVEASEEESAGPGREVGRTAIGLIGTVGGAQLAVWGATDAADSLGVSGGFIGFSLVALGTSLPELVTTVACARRGETELIVGNLFGSNIFNALAVGGALGLIGPGGIGDGSLTGFGVAAMLTVALASFGLAATGAYLDRKDGAVLLSLYVAAMVLLGTGGDDEIVVTDDEPRALVVAATWDTAP